MGWKIRVNNLSIYDSINCRFLIEGLTLLIQEGENLALIGPTGCGKTTFALALMGFLPPHLQLTGQLLFEGESNKWRAGQEKSMIFQDPHRSFNPFLTLKNHLRALGDSPLFLNRDYKSALKEVHLPVEEAFLNKFPHQLSGGEKQRLLLIMALWKKPRFLIADEPTTSLDWVVKEEMLKLIRKLRGKYKFTLLLLSHDESTLAHLVDKRINLRSYSSTSKIFS